MQSNRRSPLANLVTMVFSAFVMLFLMRDGRIRMVADFLLFRGEPSLRKLEFIWRADPQSMIIFAVFILLGLTVLVNLFRLIAGLARLGAGSARKMAADMTDLPGAASGNREIPRSAAGKTARTVKSGKQGGQQISGSYTYKSGQERYLEQLDGFLRDGMVTREQYEELLRMYRKTDPNSRK